MNRIKSYVTLKRRHSQTGIGRKIGKVLFVTNAYVCDRMNGQVLSYQAEMAPLYGVWKAEGFVVDT